MSTVLVVGPGRAGSAVARIHARSGDQVLLLGRRPGPWQARGRRAGCRPLLALPAGTRPQTVVFAVADDQLVDASRAVALQLEAWPRRLTVHLSGLHGFVPLAPFARRGERIAALHPVVAFAEAGRPMADLAGAAVTVMAAAGSVRAARALARDWGGRPLELPDGVDRRRYHLALSLAANHVTALVAWAEELLEPALGQEGRRLALDLADSALARCRADGPLRALTGPVVRGDLATVEAHLRSLRGRERRRYLGLLENLIRQAERSGRLPADQARALRGLAES